MSQVFDNQLQSYLMLFKKCYYFCLVMNEIELNSLLVRLIALPKENEYVEFKENNFKSDEIGKWISALSNSACLHGQPFGYLVLGVNDKTHQIAGTSFQPSMEKVGNNELENWLSQMLSPRIDFRIYEFESLGKKIALFHIPAVGGGQPVRFQNTAFIRIGSITRELKDFPEKEKKIWQHELVSSFEKQIAASRLSADEVIALLDSQAVFEMLLKLPYPRNQSGVLEKLIAENLVKRSNGHYAITNLGALLFAKRLEDFSELERKTVRVLQYARKNKVETLKEQIGKKGYAIGFDGLLLYLHGLLPANEEIERALRREVSQYPMLALRELIANALVHQDFRERGSGPMIEVFSDRIEVSNPGKPTINTDRFIDEFQSRNEALASAMRRIGFCEEKGSGIDKVVSLSEVYQLPAPDFRFTETRTTAILFAPKSLAKMDKKDKVRACYQHSCLRYVSNERMTNQSLRERFRIEVKNSAIASRIIKDTLDENLIRLEDAGSSKKFARYVPFWA
ncbi:MAG: ATP-binding protein [Saprospiraceae bacterium]|nr:ATP-binding protein [Saprospiraceae bacterium]